jgi:hypothetical protein
LVRILPFELTIKYENDEEEARRRDSGQKDESRANDCVRKVLHFKQILAAIKLIEIKSAKRKKRIGALN